MLEAEDKEVGERVWSGRREDFRIGKNGFLLGLYSSKEYRRLPHVATFLKWPSLTRSSRPLTRRSAGESQGLNADTSNNFRSGVLGRSIS